MIYPPLPLQGGDGQHHILIEPLGKFQVLDFIQQLQSSAPISIGKKTIP